MADENESRRVIMSDDHVDNHTDNKNTWYTGMDLLSPVIVPHQNCVLCFANM